jgi:ElaB/YqjD/DUF883 family membrane-anchored ribosome-binding protein
MDKYTRAIGHDMVRLLEDGSALVAATADVAEEKVMEARKRLALALDRAEQLATSARDKGVQVAQAADEAVHEHPYKAIAIGAGVGAVFGFIVAWRWCRNGV